MLKLIIFIIAAYAVYRLFKNDFLKKKKRDEVEEEAKTAEQIAAGDMIQDPECGAYVSIADSLSVRNGDKIYYFCSYECRDKFLKRLESGSSASTQGK